MYDGESNFMFVHEWVDVKMDASLKIKFMAFLEAANLLNQVERCIGFIHFTEIVKEVNVSENFIIIFTNTLKMFLNTIECVLPSLMNL